MEKLRVLIAMMIVASAASLISCEQSEMDDLSPALETSDVQMTNGNGGSDPNKPPQPGDD